MVSRAAGPCINLIKQMGFPQIMLSTDINPVVKIRVKRLNISAIQGQRIKDSFIIESCKIRNINHQEIIYIGMIEMTRRNGVCGLANCAGGNLF
tara:strand:+ start:48 stop:329 length:282 start_codon:yes stop_codon:yes gene_type:complete